MGAGACLVSAGAAMGLTVDFLHPRVLFEPPTRFRIGPPDSIPVGTVTMNEEFRVYIMRFRDGMRAMSAVCTHLGCITRYQPDAGIIACPCHGSRYDLDGDVIAGPAPRHLRWLEMSLDPSGQVVVDTGVEVPQGTVYRF